MIILTPELYTELLKCEEYSPYIWVKPGKEGIYIDFKRMPKDNYLPINGNYVDGLIFCNKLNDADKERGLIRVYFKEF